jgi:hypothetical protein
MFGYGILGTLLIICPIVWLLKSLQEKGSFVARSKIRILERNTAENSG